MKSINTLNTLIFPPQYFCLNCGKEFDPISSRWLCPFCKYKANCCEGEPQ